MHQINLNEKYTLSFEQSGKKIRLIVSAANEKLVCRKETINNLKSFLLKDQLRIFKGRLQLNKLNDIIEVVMKDKPIAIVSASNFEHVLNNLQ